MTDGNVTQDAQAVADAVKVLAQDDLATLQAMNALVTNPATTVQQLGAAIETFPGSLGDPARQQQAQSLTGAYLQLLDGLATMISQANAAAGN